MNTVRKLRNNSATKHISAQVHGLFFFLEVHKQNINNLFL